MLVIVFAGGRPVINAAIFISGVILPSCRNKINFI
jgi:hypothetical protein